MNETHHDARTTVDTAHALPRRDGRAAVIVFLVTEDW